MNNDKSLDNVRYVYDDDLWFFPPETQCIIAVNWVSKINPHNKKLYYINPKLFITKRT